MDVVMVPKSMIGLNESAFVANMTKSVIAVMQSVCERTTKWRMPGDATCEMQNYRWVGGWPDRISSICAYIIRLVIPDGSRECSILRNAVMITVANEMSTLRDHDDEQSSSDRLDATNDDTRTGISVGGWVVRSVSYSFVP